MANDFSNDSNCVALWKCDTSDILADSIGGNNLTNDGMLSKTDYYMEGDGSTYAQSANQTQYITSANMDAAIPFKQGDSNVVFSICFWFRPESTLVSWARYIMGMWESGSALSWLIYIVDTTSRELAVVIRAGGANEPYYTGYNLIHDRWYHMGFTYNYTDGSFKLRVWDDTAQSVVVNASDNFVNPMQTGANGFNIGGQGNRSYQGWYDEVVVFDRVLTVDEIDEIRNAAYGEQPLTPPSSPPACAALTVYCRNALLDHLFDKSTFTQPTIYIGLADSSGTEFTGGSYARVATSSSDWSVATSKVTTSLSDFEFPTPTANWGIANKLQLWDASTGGNKLAEADLDEQQNIVAGLQDIIVEAGSITATAQGMLEDEFLEAMLDHLFGHSVMTPLDECWIALCDNYGDEPAWSGSGYYREQMLPSDWGNASGGAIANYGNITFNQPLSNWGTIYICRLWSDSTYGDSGGLPSGGATLIATAWFYDPVDVTSIDPGPEFLSGNLRVRLL
jgi:hypothetical protein